MQSSKENSNQKRFSDFSRNELILNSAGEGICCIDLDGKISFANPAAIEILGWGDESFVGFSYYHVFFCFSEDHIDELACTPIQFALLDGESSQVSSETFYQKNNAPILVEYICVPLKTNNETIGAVVTFQDINERVDIESAVAEARDSALESARTKMAFLANMSHEIRTPLNGIIGMSSLLADTKLLPEQLHYTNVIKESAEFLLGIVNEILDFSKIEAGKLELETTPFNLREFLDGVITFFKPEAQKKGLSLDLEIIENANFDIIGDSNRLRQVFNNLISNAIKFTENGGIILEVNIENRFDSIFAKFRVVDSGIGISENRREYLFEPFIQADVSTTRKYGGTGLGLAISKQIVSMMSGEIGLETETITGSAFWFSVSFSLAEKQRFIIPKSTQSTGKMVDKKAFGSTNSDYSHLSVLVAEDNDINRQVAAGILKTFSVDVEFAKNGREAVEMFQLKEYDLIIMDCQMPELDGYEATKEIRRIESNTRQIPIVAMTAGVLTMEREKCIESGMNGFVGKPFSRSDIEDMLAKYLGSKLKKLDSKTSFVQHYLSEILGESALASLVSIEDRGETGFVKNTLELYFEQANLAITEIRKALQEQNSVELEKRAHFLRGSSGTIGLLEVFRLCADLEECAPSKNWQVLESHVEQIETVYENSKQAICALLKENSELHT
jgi:PAS domain S-box-containing protein